MCWVDFYLATSSNLHGKLDNLAFLGGFLKLL
jgi:hypothetical protein